MPKTKKLDYIYSVGRRKSSSARVRLYRGKGETTVNGKKITNYFPGVLLEGKWTKPFGLTQTSDKYYATIKVVGGGITGQVEAVAQALSKALSSINEEYKKTLKKAGLLTRDARIKERRKAGTGGKARRKKQSPKR